LRRQGQLLGHLLHSVGEGFASTTRQNQSFLKASAQIAIDTTSGASV